MLYSPQDNQGGTKDWKAGADKTTQPADPTNTAPGTPATPQDNDPAKVDVTKGQANTGLGAK